MCSVIYGVHVKQFLQNRTQRCERKTDGVGTQILFVDKDIFGILCCS